MLLYGGSFVAMKAAVQYLDPWLIVLGRLLLALAAFSLYWKRIPPINKVRAHIPKLMLMALSEPCLYFVFEAKALTLTQASQAGVITALLPVMVACAAGLFLHERTSRRGWLGLAMGVAGATLLSAFAPEDQYSPNPALGNLLEFAAMACATVYTLMVKHLVRVFPPLFLTAFQVIIGAIFFLPALLISPWPAEIHWEALAAIAYLGIGVSVGAYSLYNYCLSKLTAGSVAAAVNLIPAFTLMLGWLLLGESLQGWQWFGIALILTGARLAGHTP
ncbi:MAG: DMT family transporter [Desulfovibrio sp.]|jgi:drug/metabolite transporter (DMT)-like permease|nr:DMT family transporter [Desulfovibrio sp.]MBI4959901.1 DMT family transporter [Desulfovibrio sp.]